MIVFRYLTFWLAQIYSRITGKKIEYFAEVAEKIGLYWSMAYKVKTSLNSQHHWHGGSRIIPCYLNPYEETISWAVTESYNICKMRRIAGRMPIFVEITDCMTGEKIKWIGFLRKSSTKLVTE